MLAVIKSASTPASHLARSCRAVGWVPGQSSRAVNTNSIQCCYSAVGLKTVGFPLAGTTVCKQSPLWVPLTVQIRGGNSRFSPSAAQWIGTFPPMSTRPKIVGAYHIGSLDRTLNLLLFCTSPQMGRTLVLPPRALLALLSLALLGSYLMFCNQLANCRFLCFDRGDELKLNTGAL